MNFYINFPLASILTPNTSPQPKSFAPYDYCVFIIAHHRLSEYAIISLCAERSTKKLDSLATRLLNTITQGFFYINFKDNYADEVEYVET